MKKGHTILIYITSAFLCILLGIYIGRNTISAVWLNNQKNQQSVSNKTTTQTQGKLNINTATVEQLQDIPGIGKTTAQNIIDYRQKNGPFQSAADLLNVKGIGQTRLNELLDYVYVPQ